MPKNKKRILYISADRGIPFGGTKGASIHVREFLEALQRTNYVPVVATAKYDKSGAYSPSYSVYSLPNNSSLSFMEPTDELDVNRQIVREAKDYYRNQAMEETISNIYKEDRFDLIYERYSLFSTAGQIFSQSEKIPFVLEVNAPLVLEASEYRNLNQIALAKSVEKLLFSNADHIIAVSEQLQQYIKNVVPQAKVSVIPNGVTLENFTGENSKCNWRSKITNNPDKDFVIGFVGNVKQWHGVDLLIDTFGELVKSEPDFSLCIIGNSDMEFRQKLEIHCQNLGIKDKIKFTGSVPFEEIPNVLKSMDVLVAPYPKLPNFYFSPLKIFEYMAAGKPIVASSIGQISDILTNEKNALLVSPGNQAEFVNALKRFKKDVLLRKRLGEDAFMEVKKKHTWQKRIEIVTEIFHNLETKVCYRNGVGHADTI